MYIIHEVSITRKYNPLTLICYVRSKKISLLPIGQTPKPPVVIVLVQHLDDIAAACSQLIRSISSVVIERDNLEKEHSGGGTEYERGKVHVTELTAMVDTYYLLNGGRICFHMDA